MSAERVTFLAESGPKTVHLEDVREGKGRVIGPFLTGIEVRKDGDYVAGGGFDQRRRVITLDAIVRRVPVVMDKIYGEYVEAGTES